MIKAVGLDESIYKKLPKELSGGMKQRCAIAQAFSIDPPILLMDEPFGALDAVTRARLQDLVRELWTRDEKKKTVFLLPMMWMRHFFWQTGFLFWDSHQVILFMMLRLQKNCIRRVTHYLRILI
mgnify:CR=1 FL=1